MLTEWLTSDEPAVRDRCLDAACRGMSAEELRAELDELEGFRKREANLYRRVRALLFLATIHRFHLGMRDDVGSVGRIPWSGVQRVLAREFEAAIDAFAAARREDGDSGPLSSALAAAYRGLAFQTLADQVRRSVRAFPPNRWMFDVRDARQHPLRLASVLLEPGAALRERTPVRMDFSHSGWSDIFFLAIDFPEGARVVNASIDLAVRGDGAPRPPVEATLHVTDEPGIRLRSVDLGVETKLDRIADVFDFARDHLGLLRAAVVAAGIVPPGVEGSTGSLEDLLEGVVGRGRGLELTSHVHGIPKGSRLAVSTTLLASLVAVQMRATGQTERLEGPLTEEERRTVLARAILGEWLGGSGGGWQDSGGLWPGIKRIEGALAAPGDPEHGVSRGRLLPEHTPLDSAQLRTRLAESLVLVHGGLAQDVGPVLEQVTERYLLRSEPEHGARSRAMSIYDQIARAVERGDVRRLGQLTDDNFHGPIQTIVPDATNAFTEHVVERLRNRFERDFWGFWMLGGMSGGGMGFLFDPRVRPLAQRELAEELAAAKARFEDALPFAMEPVVYDFAFDDVGTRAELVPASEPSSPPAPHGVAEDAQALATLLETGGFDRARHERAREDLRAGRIGLHANRLAPDTRVEDVTDGDVVDVTQLTDADAELGRACLAKGAVAVVTLAGGSGSRWTRGAGVVKALHPFARLRGRHRSFLELHLRKTARSSELAGTPIPHVVTTSFLSHEPIERALRGGLGHDGPVLTSPGRSIGLRLVPTERDLRFAFEEVTRQRLDERAQIVRESLNDALIRWARNAGEASDYTDNLARQCVHPPGHAFEVPNLLRNGTLKRLLDERPQLRVLFLHNADTVGANVDPAWLGRFLESVADVAFEVVPRWFEDRGGGLARVDGALRLVESLAFPRDEDELRLSYYSSMTTWIDVDRLLAHLGLEREGLADDAAVRAATDRFLDRLPTYVTLKDVKKRWGRGQEDVFPVAQTEKLWGDVTALEGVRSAYFAVPRARGQQLKEPAWLDPWRRDGSAAHVESLCAWS